MEEQVQEGGVVHVFVGPSCPAPVLRTRFPQVRLHSPIKHGDLFAEDIRPGDTVVIIDGLYHQTLALRHKEVLDAMDRGVTVIGAGSIGAFRAVELGPFGMIGSGVVFGWYRDGVFEGDDAVAVAHADGNGYAALSVPLVNFYAALLAAADADIVERGKIGMVMDEAARVFYPERTVDRIVEVLKEAGWEGLADWYSGQMAEDPIRYDRKRADVFEAVALALSGAVRTAVGPLPAGASDRNWRTIHFNAWRDHFFGAQQTPPLPHRIAFQKIFNPEFPDVWWEYLKESLTSSGSRIACQDWTELSEHPLDVLGLDPADLERASAETRTRVATLICPIADVAQPDVVTMLLSRERPEHLSTLRTYLAEADRMAAELTPAAHEELSRGGKFGKLLSSVWGVELRQRYSESRRRGFPSASVAASCLRRLTIGVPTQSS
ncbi:TfuA-like protein [Streptomyces sp. MMBL 11-3]|uniref:TfuA-like protein n=1 Tax=Streptomyces sp. MMBL 11-3 TaxID=3382639 RepID=UPI0039B3FECD